MGRDADRYVDRLLRGRRPEPFTPTDDELAEIRTAIELVGSRPDDARPRDGFVDDLRDRLAAAQQDPAGSAAAPVPAAVRPARPALSPARRRLLQAGAVAASAFAAGFATDRCLGPDRGRDRTAADAALTPSRGTWHTVAAASDLPEGAVRDFDLGAVAGFVHRDGGRLRAVSGVCTHQACRLTLDDARATLVCPCHGATFTLAGDPLHNFRSHRPLPPLPRLAVRRHEGLIQVYGPASPPAGA